MRIAFVSSGNTIHVKKIANVLISMGHEITLFTLPDHNKLIPDFDKSIRIVKLPFAGKKGYYLNIPYLRKKLKSGNYDLVNCHYASGFGTLARLAGVHPLALAVFGTDVYDYPYKSVINMKRIIKNLDNADVITSTSKVMADKVREYYHADKEIYITPFGVDLNQFHPSEVEKDDVFEFGIVKEIEHKYGIDILLKAYQGFRNEVHDPKSRLVIYGRGSALEEYKVMAKELGIDNYVQFKGFVQNELVPQALSHMNVACFPSISESFGVAAVEAMACGTPVIASDAPGFTEVIEDGVTGMLVPKRDIDALKNAMIKMYRLTSQQRKQLGQAGRDRVVQLYNFDDNMQTYVNAIQHALKEK